MSLQDVLQDLTASPVVSTSVREDSAKLADEARSIMAVLLARPTADVRKMIDVFAPVAESFLQDIISGKYPDASLALRAKYASLALARAGFGPVHHIHSLNATLTRDDVEAIKQRAIQVMTDDSRQRQEALRDTHLKDALVTNNPVQPTALPSVVQDGL